MAEIPETAVRAWYTAAAKLEQEGYARDSSQAVRVGLAAAYPLLAAQAEAEALERAARIVEQAGDNLRASNPDSGRAIQAFAKANATAIRIAARYYPEASR